MPASVGGSPEVERDESRRFPGVCKVKTCLMPATSSFRALRGCADHPFRLAFLQEPRSAALGMNKYRKVMKPRESMVKDDDEIRVTAAGRVSACVSRAAKFFNELERSYLTITATGNALTKAVTAAEVIKRRFKGIAELAPIVTRKGATVKAVPKSSIAEFIATATAAGIRKTHTAEAPAALGELARTPSRRIAKGKKASGGGRGRGRPRVGSVA